MENLNEVDNKYNLVISNFEGPLDLLCFLISKNKMNIFDISLSELTDKYIEYINMAQDMDMEVTTEFIVMASTLLYIKSKKLIPMADPEDVEEVEVTEQELIEKIAKYRMYKEKQEVFRQMYEAGFGSFEKMPEKIKFSKKVNLKELLFGIDLSAIYNEILNRKLEKINKKAEEIDRIAIYEKVTIKSKVIQIMNEFKKKTSFVFGKMFDIKKTSRIDVVTAFLSVLELSRLKHVEIRQKEMFGDIEINKVGKTDIDVSLIKE